MLEYLKTLEYAAIAPGIPFDFITGEQLEIMGLYEDGESRFPIEFVRYYENCDIGIPSEYEKYLIEVKHLEKK